MIFCLPDSQGVLHDKADNRNAYPTAHADKNRFAAALYELNYIGVKADGRHCHNDEELAESLQWHKYFIWYAC